MAVADELGEPATGQWAHKSAGYLSSEKNAHCPAGVFFWGFLSNQRDSRCLKTTRVLDANFYLVLYELLHLDRKSIMQKKSWQFYLLP